jgi:hypothetical protein
MTDTYILQEQYFGKYYWPLNYWPVMETPFGFAEIWRANVIMNMSVPEMVVMNCSVPSTYEELEEL